VEEKSSWLPAGLESSRTDPDDRASQRGRPEAGKRSDRAPKAAGEQGPYDSGDPSRGRRSESESGGPEKKKRSKPERRWTEQPEAKDSEPKADGEREPRAEGTKRPKAEGNGQPKAEGNGQPKAAGDGEPKAEGADAADQRSPGGQGSDVDAMGQDKHRRVIGQHNPHRGRQFLYYGIFIAFLAAAYIGLKAGADALDKAPAHDPDQAPWSKPGAPQGPLGGFEPKEAGRKGPTHFQ
jgi:hypothetical protein